MDALRYGVGLLAVACGPGVFVFWFSIHPFVRFWRRRGVAVTLAVHIGAIVAIGVGVGVAREALMGPDIGTGPVTLSLAALCWVGGGTIRYFQHRQFGLKRLLGVPELDPKRGDNRLVTEGIYAYLRHPRYVELVLAFWGMAFFSGYVGAYVVAALSVPWAGFLAPVEENELRARFGDAYDRYAERVPRFLPRFPRS